MVDEKTIMWLAGLFIGSISANVGLVKIILNDSLERPNRMAFILNGLLSLIGGIFGYLLANFLLSFLFVAFNIFTFLVVFFGVKKRDVKAVDLGEKLLSSFKIVDVQICYILSELNRDMEIDLGKPIRRTLRYILAEISNILGINGEHHAELCILVPENFKFRVVAYFGIPSYKIKTMEDKFSYGDESNSLAGYAMNKKELVLINDLSDGNTPNVEKWVRMAHNEKKEGSIFVYPILRDIGSSNSDPIAIISVSSEKKESFNPEIIKQLFNYFSPKIEILQNCWEISVSRKNSV